MEIKGFDPRDLKMCHVATLADLGYRTTVTVANGFTGGRVPRDDVDVSLEVRDPEGDPIFSRDLMSIVPGEYAVVDLSRELDLQGVETSRDVLATIRLRPPATAVWTRSMYRLPKSLATCRCPTSTLSTQASDGMSPADLPTSRTPSTTRGSGVPVRR